MARPLKLLALSWKATKTAVRERPAYFGVFLFFLCGLALLVALAFGAGAERTLLIDARTNSVQVEFKGDSNAWPVDGALVCTPLARPDLRADRGDAVCDARLFGAPTPGVGFVTWGDGGSADISMDKTGTELVIRVLRSSSHVAETRILVPLAEWRRVGAFGWIGHVTVGRQATSGEAGLLVQGTFEAREVLSFLPESLRTTEVVKTGVMRSGEKVSLVARQDCPWWSTRPRGEPESATCREGTGDQQGSGTVHLPVTAFGHVTLDSGAADDGAVNGFRVVALTAPGKTALSIAFAGADRPVLIRPNWIDRLTTSPVVSALATALTVAVALVSLAISFGNAAEQVRTGLRTNVGVQPIPAADVAVSVGPLKNQTVAGDGTVQARVDSPPAVKVP
jgi:hypothetical protein